MTDTEYGFWLLPAVAFPFTQHPDKPLVVKRFSSLVYAYKHASWLLNQYPQATCCFFKAWDDDEVFEQTRRI